MLELDFVIRQAWWLRGRRVPLRLPRSTMLLCRRSGVLLRRRDGLLETRGRQSLLRRFRYNFDEARGAAAKSATGTWTWQIPAPPVKISEKCFQFLFKPVLATPNEREH